MNVMPWVAPPPKPKAEGLTDQQQHFVDFYMLDPNERRAASSAGYSATAKPLSSLVVLEEVRQRQAERSERNDIDSGWMLRRLGEEIDADLADLYDEHMQLKPVHDWPLIWRKGLVNGLDTTETTQLNATVTKIKLADRTKRLELIGKHVNVNAFTEKIDITKNVNVNVSSVVQLEQFLERINPPIIEGEAVEVLLNAE